MAAVDNTDSSIPVTVESAPVVAVELDAGAHPSEALDSVPEDATAVVADVDAPIAEAATVGTMSKRSPFGSLLTRTLPRYTGPYKVGVTDVELPIERQSFGNFKHKAMNMGAAGLSIETVFFTLFYPAEPPVGSNSRVVWFPK